MKMITAIVQDEDAPGLLDRLMEENFRATKIGSTGGFLKKGNVTLIVGVEDKDVDRVIDIIRERCHIRTETLSTRPPLEVAIGGAAIFVQNVERYEKL